MLQSIRERATGWILWVIIGLIAVPFAFFGVYNYLSGGSPSVAANVNGVDISLRALNDTYQQQRQRLEQIFGGQLDPELIDEDRLRREALEQLINEAVLAAFVAERGFALDDPTLAAIIRGQEYFQVDGEFSSERYDVVLSQAGLSPRAYEARVRRSEMIDQLQGGIYASAVIPPAVERQVIALQGQQRELAYLRVAAEAFADQVEVTEAEMQAYYEAHPDAFRTPERVRLEYVELSAEQLLDRAEVDEQAVRRRYEELKDSRFTEGGERRVSHILIQVPEDAGEEQLQQARKQIRDIRQQLEQGADFAELAREYSEDPGSAEAGGDLGVLEPGMMVEPFEQAATRLAEGEVSEPVRTRFGLHLIKATEVEPGQTQPFEQVRNELEREIAEEQMANELYEMGSELANLAYENPDSLQPAAEHLGLDVQRSDWISRRAGEGLGGIEAVREAAFSEEVLQQGRNSRLLELEDGRQVIVRVAEHQPAQRQPLEAVAEEVRAQVRADEAEAEAQELAAQLAERVEAGAELASLAEDRPAVSYVDAGLVGRGSSEVPREVLQQAFRLPKPSAGEPSRARVELPQGDQVLLAVTAVQEGTAEALEPEQRERLVQQLEALYGDAAIAGFVQALREEAEVTIYEDRL